MHPELNFIKNISWDEVFALWEKEEASMPHWIEHYTQKGFFSWKEWRSHTISGAQLERLTWALFEIKDPGKNIPLFHAGPFRAWMKKYYRGQHTCPFGALAEIPEIENDPTIAGLIKDFPSDSTMIGLHGAERLTIIEGLHRGCAVALAARSGVSIDKKIYLACADYPGEIPPMGSENSPT